MRLEAFERASAQVRVSNFLQQTKKVGCSTGINHLSDIADFELDHLLCFKDTNGGELNMDIIGIPNQKDSSDFTIV